MFLAGGSVVIHGFVFPVAGPTQFIDSFGFPRMPGTAYEHWHEGTDIFADGRHASWWPASGASITRMGTNVLGGITLWLRGESGVSYYYAHLSGYAPGVGVGMVVEPGTVLGYAGNTGNAADHPAAPPLRGPPATAARPSTRTRSSTSPSTRTQPEPIRLDAPPAP